MKAIICWVVFYDIFVSLFYSFYYICYTKLSRDDRFCFDSDCVLFATLLSVTWLFTMWIGVPYILINLYNLQNRLKSEDRTNSEIFRIVSSFPSNSNKENHSNVQS